MKLLLKVLLELSNSSLIITRDDNVINRNNKVNTLAKKGMKGAERMISLTHGHAKQYQDRTEATKNIQTFIVANVNLINTIKMVELLNILSFSNNMERGSRIRDPSSRRVWRG